MALTVEAPAEPQNPHFNPEIAIDSLSESIFNETNGFSQRHAGLFKPPASILYQNTEEGQEGRSFTVIRFGYDNSSQVNPNATTYRWQVSTSEDVTDIVVSSDGIIYSLVGWRSERDDNRKTQPPQELKGAEILSTWWQISGTVINNEGFREQTLAEQEKRLVHQIVLSQLEQETRATYSDNTLEKDRVSQFRLSRPFQKLVRSLFAWHPATRARRVQSDSSLEMARRATRDALTELGFVPTEFIEVPDAPKVKIEPIPISDQPSWDWEIYEQLNFIFDRERPEKITLSPNRVPRGVAFITYSSLEQSGQLRLFSTGDDRYKSSLRLMPTKENWDGRQRARLTWQELQDRAEDFAGTKAHPYES